MRCNGLACSMRSNRMNDCLPREMRRIPKTNPKLEYAQRCELQPNTVAHITYHMQKKKADRLDCPKMFAIRARIGSEHYWLTFVRCPHVARNTYRHTHRQHTIVVYPPVCLDDRQLRERYASARALVHACISDAQQQQRICLCTSRPRRCRCRRRRWRGQHLCVATVCVLVLRADKCSPHSTHTNSLLAVG